LRNQFPEHIVVSCEAHLGGLRCLFSARVKPLDDPLVG